MNLTERVVLTEDYEHPVHGEQRVFRAGAHTLPTAIADAARAAGKVEGPPPGANAVRAAKPRIRKPAPAKAAPAKKAPAKKTRR